MNTYKLISFLLFICIMIVFLAGCQPSTPTPTQPTPTEYPLDNGPEFDCWNAQGSPANLVTAKDLLFIVAFSPITPPPSYQERLLSFDPDSLTYQVVIPNTYFQPGYPDDSISPMRNAISYTTLDEFENSKLNIYDVWRNVLIQLPDPNSTYPNWSPDGQCIFFDYGESHLAYRLSDGALQKKHLPDIDTWPGYFPSPNGLLKVFSEETGVSVVDSDSNALVSPAFEAACYVNYIRWSPDSKYLVFAYAKKCQRLRVEPYIVRLIEFHEDGTISYENILEIINYPSQIEWANDSAALFIDGNGGIQKYDLTSRKMTNLSESISGGVDVTYFCISANGKKMYYIDNDTSNGDPELYSLDLITGKNTAYPLPEEYRAFETDPKNTEQDHPSFIGLYCAVKPTP